MSCVNCLLLIIFFSLLVLSLSHEHKCDHKCRPFQCGVLGSIGFPFHSGTYSECGFLRVDHCSKQFPRIKLEKDWPWFDIISISQDNTVTLGNNQLAALTEFCDFRNLSLADYPFISVEPFYQYQFRCPLDSVPQNLITQCKESKQKLGYQNVSSDVEFLRLNPNCSLLKLQDKSVEGVEFLSVYTGLFRLRIKVTGECLECFHEGGQCKTDYKGKFQCANRKGDGKLRLKLGLRLAIPTIGIGMLIVLAFCYKRKSSPHNFMAFWRKKTKDCQNIEVFLKNLGSLAPKRYRYSDIKKMTNSFKHKIGQGGFGEVYKGRLLDGRNAAVKFLTKSKGNGEDFINEVASISKTSHVNIVTFLGFCFEGRRRALIYEFVSNGSLEKFIDDKNPLKWETLSQIAVGIARGLEYLHRGCSTRILHFDIKPHNILLDEDFCPKISDFGLAKICSKKESIVSMSGARGTIGYIAPEVFCRNFGAISHKSDVYSYGMTVLKIIEGRQNNNVGIDKSSEIYFPQWIYERLEVHEELGLQNISNEEDKECVRKMIIVSLWCIQNNPSDRPTMSRVVEMLEGSINSLQIPPKPFLSSSPIDSSILSRSQNDVLMSFN